MKVTVAVDPGLSTGVAVFEEDELVTCVTTKPPHTFLRFLLMNPNLEGFEVVAEEPPSPAPHNEEATGEPVLILREYAEAVTWIRPNQWKGHPAARLDASDLGHTKSIHERDAVKLGRWYLQQRRLDVLNAPSPRTQPSSSNTGSS